MTITVRGTSTGPNNNATTTAISLPTGVAVGDVTIIAYINSQNNFASIGMPVLTAPSGWTTLANAGGVLVCWRAFQSGDPTTGITATSTVSNWWESAAITYAGLDTTSPIDTSNICITGSGNSGTGITLNGRYRAPSVHPNWIGSQLLCVYVEGGSTGRTLTLPSGMTAQALTSSGPNILLCDKALTTGAATGNIESSVAATSAIHAGMQIALKAASASAATLATPELGLAGFANNDINTGTISLPLDWLGVKDGDMVLATFSGADAVTVAPTGYTAQSTYLGGQAYTHAWATGDATNPTFLFSGAVNYKNMDVVLIRKIGITTSIITLDGVSAVTGSGTLATGSLTPSGANDLLVVQFGQDNSGGATWSSATGGLIDEDINSAGPCTRFSWLSPASVPTGSFSATTSYGGTLSGLAILFALAAPYVPPPFSPVNDRDKMLMAESPRYTTGGVAPADLATATGTISAAQIAANAVTAAAIAANAVTTAAIAANAVTTALLASGAVTSAKIGNLAVTTATIDNLAVDTLQIAGNAVTVNQIVTGSSTLTGATATTGGSTGTPATILTLTLTVAYAGYFLASFACRQGSNSGPKPWTMSLNFDGTPVFATGGGVLGATGYAFTDSVSMAGAAFLAAGSHTVDVVWTGDTTMEIDARTLSVVSAMK